MDEYKLNLNTASASVLIAALAYSRENEEHQMRELDEEFRDSFTTIRNMLEVELTNMLTTDSILGESIRTVLGGTDKLQ